MKGHWLCFIAVFTVVLGYVLLPERVDESAQHVDLKEPNAPLVDSSVTSPKLPSIDIDASSMAHDETDWLNEELRTLFDYFVSFYEESDTVMWMQFNEHCKALSYCNELRDLFSRYIDYKMQLHEFDSYHESNLDTIRRRLDQISALQLQLFSEAERQALFEPLQQWDEYALQRMAINRDETLNDQQKAELLAHHISQLPDGMRQAVTPTQTLRKITALMADESSLGSHQFNELAAEVGQPAAERLIKVKQARQAWQQRVNQYRDDLKTLKLEYADDATRFNQLKKELTEGRFSSNEQKRLRVLLKHQN